MKRSNVFHRAFETEQNVENFIAPTYQKSVEDTRALTELFKTNFLTKHIDPSQHVVLANAMFKVDVKGGNNIIKYGDIGNEYYVLARGSCQVTVYHKDTNPADPNLSDKIDFVKTIETNLTANPPLPMVGFGEIALLYNDRRSASITATTNCELWVLSGNVFKQVIAQNSIRRRNISLEYLDKCDLLKELDKYEKLKLIDGLKIVQYSAGEYILH